MGKITEVSAADQPADLKDKVKGYWSKRSESFLKIRHAELGSQKAQLWADELERLLTMPDEDVPVRLQVGAGRSEILFEAEAGQTFSLNSYRIGHRYSANIA